MPKFSQSRMAAKLQRIVSYRREEAGLYREIAEKLSLSNDERVLDIGTGSGVLLITAILCGLKTGLGNDIDACARVEAAANVRINGLEDRVVVSGQSLADIRHRFPLILANLRYPSLIKMLFQINERAETNSYLILSGIRDDELDDLLKVYEKIQFKKMWSGNELGWAGVVLRRGTIIN